MNTNNLEAQIWTAYRATLVQSKNEFRTLIKQSFDYGEEDEVVELREFMQKMLSVIEKELISLNQ